MHTDALANVYARSLYELAQKAGAQDKINEVAAELDQISELLTEDKRFREFLSSPIIDKNERGVALKKMFTNRVTDLTLRFLLVLNNKGRLGHFGPIAEAFDHLVQEAFGRVEVDVFTAAPLGREQLDGIRDRIRQALGRDPVLHAYTEAAMLGGLKLRIGDQLIDGSVATKLRRMKQNLSQAGATRLRSKFDRIIDA